jgi:hypothetical protein
VCSVYRPHQRYCPLVNQRLQVNVVDGRQGEIEEVACEGRYGRKVAVEEDGMQDSCGRSVGISYRFGACPDRGEVGVMHDLPQTHRTSRSYAGQKSRLTLHDVLHARQVREDFEIVLGSPALLHAGISRSAAGTTPRGVPGLSWPYKAFCGRAASGSPVREVEVFCTEGRSVGKAQMLGLRGSCWLMIPGPRR